MQAERQAARRSGIPAWACLGAALGIVVALWEATGQAALPPGAAWAAAGLYGGLGLVFGWLLAPLPLLRRVRGRLSWWLGLGLSLLAGAACAWSLRTPSAAEAPAAAPEILILTCDTTRDDRWWAMARHAAEEEGARPFERQAVVFENSYVNKALTGPSHASLFTGLYSHEHGVLNNGAVLGPHPSLATSLSAAGYTTLAAPSVIHLDPGFGFARGFDDFSRVEDGIGGSLRSLQGFFLVRALLRLTGAGRAVRDGEETLQAAERLWQEAAGEAPRALWVHVFEPHWPYEPRQESLSGAIGVEAWPELALPGYRMSQVRPWRERYDAEVLEARRILRDFVERLRADRGPQARPLWVFFTSDHGEALGEHGTVDHGDVLYEEQLRVPLWMQLPGVEAAQDGRRIATPVAQIDFYPSLLEGLAEQGCRFEAPQRISGRSWWPAVRGEELPEVPLIASTRHASFDNLMVRIGDLKVIRYHRSARARFLRRPDERTANALPKPMPWEAGWEAFDLARDPWEQHPLERPVRSAGPERVEMLEGFDTERRAVPFAQHLSPDVVESLFELGYF